MNTIAENNYKRLKRLKGERFAQTLRNHHNGILSIPDIIPILRHAGDNAQPLLPYLMSLLNTNDDGLNPCEPEDPFILLEQAGYTAFYADTLEKQNSIKKYFKSGELLCTFNDHARHEKYYIVHAIREDADELKREDFRGKEQRQDSYGTSVISIQMLKKGGFISIKNRYNHSVVGSDHTFDSNPDNIIEGLSVALRTYFNVEFSQSKVTLTSGYALCGKKIFKYNLERNNIYYGDQAWVKNGIIHEVDLSNGDALFDEFLFDNKKKILIKIDPRSQDSFADDFNRIYGGNNNLRIRNGNLMLGDTLLIGADKSQIKTLNLPHLKSMSSKCLQNARGLSIFSAPHLVSMGNWCFFHANDLTEFHAAALVTMGKGCLKYASNLKEVRLPNLTTMGKMCFKHANSMTTFYAPMLRGLSDHRLQRLARENIGQFIPAPA